MKTTHYPLRNMEPNPVHLALTQSLRDRKQCRLTWLLAIALGCGIAPSVSQAEQATKPSIYVAPFENDIGEAIAWWQPAIGSGLAEMLITELTKSRKFRVLESTAQEDLKQGIQGQRGWVREEEQIQRGQWLGADYMLHATITRFGAVEKKKTYLPSGISPFRLGGSPIGFSSTKHIAEVEISWRIVDTESGEIKFAHDSPGIHEDKSLTVGSYYSKGGFDQRQFLGSALGKATKLALADVAMELEGTNLGLGARSLRMAQQTTEQDLAEQQKTEAQQRTPGKVTGVAPGGVVIVDLGKSNGLEPGATLTLFKPVQTLNNQGQVIWEEDEKCGEIILVAVQDKQSRARYEGSAEVKEGWKVQAQP
jgi:curli biogenesis system outer membrane secretion channel CsgG